MDNKKVVTRFAPSPTGNLHIGGARTALFNYLFSRHHNGQFLLRIEDTDKERSTKDFEKSILDGLNWLGLKWDNDELYRQSEHTDLYKKYIEKLIKENKAYISKEKKEKESDREEVIRFRNPNVKIKFDDLIRGEIEFDTTELGDFIIAKSFDEPIFHLTNVIDDIEMGITHIIRGEDHISNTPRQILIWDAIGAPRAIYAHLPLILATDRSKLSKRHGAVNVYEYRNIGYLPDALLNFLSLLGWNPGDDKEIFSLDEAVKVFNISKAQKGGAVFNEVKLKWINKEYIKKISSDDFLNIVKDRLPNDITINERIIKHISILLRDRINILSEIDDSFKNGEFDFLYKDIVIEKDKLVWKTETIENTKKRLNTVLDIIKNINPNDFNKDMVKDAIWPYADKEGRGGVLSPFRYALSGKERSPDPFTISEIIGKDETIKRLIYAIQYL